jgi:hypothetical protein
LNLNSCTLTGSSSDSGVITFYGGTLTITDSSVDKKGKITTNVTIDSKNFGTINVNCGSLIVDSGAVENQSKKLDVHTIAVSSGSVTINGGNLSRSNHYVGDYTIYNAGGTVYVNGGTVSGVSSYAIYNTSGTVNINGGEVTSNNSTVFNSGTVNVTGGEVRCEKKRILHICN